MPAISEEAEGAVNVTYMSRNLLPSTATSPELRNLQEQYSELSARYAKLTADYAIAQQTSSDVSQTAFTQAVEAVGETYARALSELDTQLSLNKAALTHAEEVIREKDEHISRVSIEAAENDETSRLIMELKSRNAKLVERETTTNLYLQDLEARLKTATDGDERMQASIAEQRKEIARYREVAVNSEEYIKDLESRLSISQDTIQANKLQIESADRELQRRERAHADLEAKLSQLDITGEHKQLLLALKERDHQVARLQSDLDAAKSDVVALEQRLSTSVAAAASEQAKLKSRLADLELSPAKQSITGQETSNREERTALHTANGNLQSLDDSVHNGENQRLLAQLEYLQKRYAESQQDLGNLTSRHQASLLELADMRQARSRNGSSTNAEPLLIPLPSPSAVSDGSGIEELESNAGDDQPTGLPSSLAFDTPNKKKRSRRSMPLSPKGSFLGKSPATTPSASHLRSLSLSQELSLAQSLNGHASTGPASLTSPRAPSPLLLRRTSLLASSQNSLLQPERSQESLLQEVKKLQEIINDRDEELRALELSVTQLRHSHSSSPSETDFTPKLVQTSTVEQTAMADADRAQLSPNTLETLDAIRASIRQPGPQVGLAAGSADEQLHRLEELMVSFARKEALHKETVHDMEEQLQTVRKQYDDLKSLSTGQIHNMSAEMAALEHQLHSKQADIALLEENVATSRSQLDEANAVHAQARESHDILLLRYTSEHQDSIDRIQKEHARSISLLEERLSELQKSLEDEKSLHLQSKKQVSTQAREYVESHAEAIKSEALRHTDKYQNLQHETEAILRRKDQEHALVLERLEAQRSSSVDADRDELIRRLEHLHRDQIEAHEAQHIEDGQRLRSEHAEHLASLHKQHVEALATLQEELRHSSNDLKDEHARQIEQSRAVQESTARDASSSHEDALTAVRTALAEEFAAKQQESDARSEMLQQKHELEMEVVQRDASSRESALRASHREDLAKLESTSADTLRTLQVQHDDVISGLTRDRDRLRLAVAHHAEILTRTQNEHNAAIAALQEKYGTALEKRRELSAVVAARSGENIEVSECHYKATVVDPKCMAY